MVARGEQTRSIERLVVVACLLFASNCDAFTTTTRAGSTCCIQSGRPTTLLASLSTSSSTLTRDEQRTQTKTKLLQLLRTAREPAIDPILADPISKENLQISRQSSSIAGNSRIRSKYQLISPTSGRLYQGSSDTYLDLLEEAVDTDTTKSSNNQLWRTVVPWIPPPLRATLANDEFIPMRDLFTSPAVSYAYERGWRQNFQTAGFPGPDQEAALAMEYFEPAFFSASMDNATLVDMSCATGLFTRRFAASKKYSRILGCDYSPSMLLEAGRRLRQEAVGETTTRVDLVRLDVAQLPMANASVTAMHAGAAMHCWPDVPTSVSEIYRVLPPGGRYFATTFLSAWFRQLQGMDTGSAPSTQAFQYFASVDELRTLMENAGFAPNKVDIEVLGSACVVIRCEK